MAQIWCTVILLLTQYYPILVGSEAQKFSNFACNDGIAEINFVQVCDGEPNCADGSDETGCDSDGILLYYIYTRATPILSSDCQRYNDPNAYTGDWYFYKYSCNSEDHHGFINLNVNGIYLNEGKEFLITVLNQRLQGRYRMPWEEELPKLTNIQISSNGGSRLDILYTSRKSNSEVHFWKRVTRDASSEENIAIIEPTHSIENLVVDWVTNNVYYISNSSIKVCDQNNVICVDVRTLLSSKFLRNPTLFTISPKYRLLFWIEKISPQQYYLFKYAIDMHSRITNISQELKAPVLLTVDPVEERVYWLSSSEGIDGVVSSVIYSISFEGTDLEAISGMSESVRSFAVFDNTLYFRSDKYQSPQIWKCSVNNCNQPILFKEVDFSAVNSSKHDVHFEIGSLNIDHRSSSSTKDECIRSSCSHLCLLDSKRFFNCYCEGSDKPLPSANTTNGFCKESTVLVANQNHLYVIGIFSNSTYPPKINKTTINIDLISTVTYDSLKGNVILTETERQKIYSWIPRTGELVPLLDDGLGSIKSIEFDNHANNLYWIDPVNFSIKVMNLDKRIKVVILQGNFTYLPVELTLAPAKGYMFVQFLKNHSTVVFERISMDGRSTKIPIYEDNEIEDVGNLHLYYMREAETLYLLDKQRNKIEYFVNEKSGFQDLTYENSVGKVQGITSMGHSIFWWEDDFIIRRGIKVDTSIFTRQTISLMAENGNGILKMAPIVKLPDQPRLTKCLRDNGGCQELCLVTEKSPKFVCVCTGNKTLVNGNACRSESISESVTNENTVVTSNNNNASSEIDRNNNEGNASTKRTENDATCIKSCPILQCPSYERITTNDESRQTKWNFSANIHKNETNYVQSCPVCQTPACSCSVEQSSVHHILFNLVLIVILAILLGFALGYLYRRGFSEYGNLKFHGEKRNNVELSQMRAVSTTTLCSKTSESTNNPRKN